MCRMRDVIKFRHMYAGTNAKKVGLAHLDEPNLLSAPVVDA